MASKLDMENGAGSAKPLVLGAIALAFGIGAYSLIKSDDTPEQEAQAAAQRPAESAAAPAAEAAVPADPAVAAATPQPMITAGTMPAASEASATPAATSAVETPALEPAAATAQATPTPEPAAPAESAAAPPAAVEPAAQPAAASAAPPQAEPAVAASETSAPAAGTATGDIVMEDGAPTGTAATDPAAEPQEAAVETASADDAPVAPVRAPAPPAVDALRPWWSASADDPFGVKYVGQAQDQAALVILFSQQVASPDTLADRIKVLGSDGQPVAGNWQQGQNPAVLVRPDLQPGRYTVVIDQAVASASGQTLQTPLHGPVHIQ